MESFERLRDSIAGLPRFPGITPLDVANLPEPFNHLITKLMRQGSMTLEQLAAEMGVGVEEGQFLAEEMVAAGLLQVEEATLANGRVYRVYYARTRRHNLPLEFG